MIREYVRDLVDGSAPGAPAPSERELVDRFGVARMTVRQALDALVAEGVLERFRGRGTFVARPRRLPTGVTSFTEEMARRGVVAEARTLVAERSAAAPSVARALGVPEGADVVHWRRLRFADGRAVCLSDAYLVVDLVPGLVEGTLPDSLYDELAARDCRPTWVEDAVSAGIVTGKEARLLEIEPGSAVMRHQRRALWNDRPVEVSRTVYPADQHVVRLQFGG